MWHFRIVLLFFRLQMTVANQITFCPNGYPQPQPGIPTTVAFTQNPLVNLNGYYMYNHFVPQQVYLPQQMVFKSYDSLPNKFK